MKTNSILFAIVATLCIALLSTTFSSCKKIEDDLDGMNNRNDYYSYWADSRDFNYNEAPGYFNTAIKEALGTEESILGGDDSKVIEACDKCYEKLKEQLHGKTGKVHIMKTRHPDGKQKEIKVYEF
jgi:hypothetical protein